MKILCLIESLASGGAERQMTVLASLLKKRGHEVAVWTYCPQDFYRKQLEEDGVEYRFIVKARNKFLRIPVLLKEARKWKPDAMIAYLPSVTLTACLMKMLGLKTRLLVSERNTSQKYGFRERLRFFLFNLEADWIVTNSHSQERFIAKHYPSLIKKIRVITNYVDTDFFTPETEKDSNEEDVLQMICVSRILPQKNVLRFIDSLAELKRRSVALKVLWYGSTEGVYARQCLEKVQKQGLSDIIEFKGVTHDVRNEYRKADVLCLPSLREGFPNVISEAMSCGLPILCSRVCDNEEIVVEGENGLLFDPRDKNDIVEKIISFVRLPYQERKIMGNVSRQMALDLFSADHFVNAYEDLLK